MIDVTSEYLGPTTPMQELVDQISRRGWQVTKVQWKKAAGGYEAKAKDPAGYELARVGPDAATAVQALLQHIIRKEFARTPTVAQVRVGMWQTTWIDKLEDIAQAYAKAPTFEPKAAVAWKALADDCVARAKVLHNQLHVEVTDDPEPYGSAEEMAKDVHEKKHIFISRAGANHPVWTVEQVVAFRLVHDVMGHVVAGAGFDWAGENKATAAHMPLLTEDAQKALFVESVAQTAYATVYRSYGPVKVCLLKDFLDDAQEEENDFGHNGMHPEHTFAPTIVPKVAGETLPKEISTWDALWNKHELTHPTNQPLSIHDWDDGWSVQQHDSPRSVHATGAMLHNCWQSTQPEWMQQSAEQGWSYHTLNDPHGIPRGAFYVHDDPWGGPGSLPQIKQPLGRNNRPLKPEVHARLADWATQMGYEVPFLAHDPAVLRPEVTIPGTDIRVSGVRRDPNHGWESHANQLPDAAYLWGGDPLDYMGALDASRKLDTKWWELDHGSQKQAVTNALRAVLLAPNKPLKWAAAHYQDLMHVPHHVDDPKVYHDALEKRRTEWDGNTAWKGHDAESQEFIRWYLTHNPDMDPKKAIEAAQRELFHMQCEEEERALAGHTGNMLEEIEPRVHGALKKRLKTIMHKKVVPGQDMPHLASNWDEDWGEPPEELLESMDPANAAPWARGSHGKGLIDHDGTLHHWAVNDWGEPHHDVVADSRNLRYHTKVDIAPSGAVAINSPDSENLFGINRADAEEKLAALAPQHGMFFRREFQASSEFGEVPEFFDWERHSPREFEGIEAEADADARVASSSPHWGIEVHGQAHGNRALDPSVTAPRQGGFGVAGVDVVGSVHASSIADDPYGGYTASSLKSIARASRYADVLHRAALEDVDNHGGKGHHFRSTALNLRVPGVTPQAASMAWYLLSPTTSQLAPVDAHHMEALGRDHAKEMNDRDYFKFERELAAGRDASGYAHMPLGMFAQSLWDHKRFGEGYHSDHDGIRVANPKSVHHHDWDTPMQRLIPEGFYAPQQWWLNTATAREEAAQQFDENVAPHHPSRAIPYHDEHVETKLELPRTSSEESTDEFHFSLALEDNTIAKINAWVGTLGIDPKNLEDPEDYHVTIVYAPHGWNDLRAHEMVKHFNFTGMKFKAKGLSHFDGGAVVIELHNDAWKESVKPVINRLKNLDVPVSEYPGGPKAHITIAYCDEMPEIKTPLALEFRARTQYVSMPRGLRQSTRLPGMPCDLHAWPDCPICVEPDQAEHNPEYAPDNDFDHHKHDWYSERKEPGLVNPKDPFADLHSPSGG